MRRNALEWAVLAVSLLAIAALIATLVLEGLSENRPADPRVELRPAEARQGELGWIIPASVSNSGDEAAEAVLLEARADVAGTTQVSTIELDFLPAGTTVEVAFAFSGQPAAEVVVRLVGYRVP